MVSGGSTDVAIVDALIEGRIDLVCSLPCNMLAGVIRIIEQQDHVIHIPITREEEGVGIAAGAYLGGKTPAILMQNSGFGNSVNALLSLTRFYQIPLLIMMSHRGRKREKIAAQIPMGDAIISLLEALGIEYCCIAKRSEIISITKFATDAFSNSKIMAILLEQELWDEEG